MPTSDKWGSWIGKNVRQFIAKRLWKPRDVALTTNLVGSFSTQDNKPKSLWNGELTHPDRLLSFFDAIPDVLKPYATIAGGAVLDLATAEDVDIFLCGLPDPCYLVPLYIMLTEKDIEWQHSEPWEYDPTAEDPSKAKKSQVTSIKFPWKDKHGVSTTVNVVASPYPTIGEALDMFDLSVCMWARRPDGSLVEGSKATYPGTPVVVYRSSMYTVHRLVKYSQRFPITRQYTTCG